MAETGAQPSRARLDAHGNLFYTARVPGGWAAFRREGASRGGEVVAADLLMTMPSPDGRFVVGNRLDVGLVRVNADGSGAAVVLQDASAWPMAFTPDGAGLLYVSNKSGHQQPWMLPLLGGEARRLSDLALGADRLGLSADGRQVIFATNDGTQICAFPAFDSCRVVKVIPGPISTDGKTVFAIDPNDPRNILAQPIDAGTPTPLTRFTDKEIQDFSLSPDGSQIAITRTTRVSDVVLIKGLK